MLYILLESLSKTLLRMTVLFFMNQKKENLASKFSLNSEYLFSLFYIRTCVFKIYGLCFTDNLMGPPFSPHTLFPACKHLFPTELAGIKNGSPLEELV